MEYPSNTKFSKHARLETHWMRAGENWICNGGAAEEQINRFLRKAFALSTVLLIGHPQKIAAVGAPPPHPHKG